MKPRRAVLPLLGLILGLSLGCGSSAHAARNLEVAIQDDNIFFGRVGGWDPGKALDLSREIGVTRIRVNAIWTEVVGNTVAAKKKQPKSIVHNWTAIDNLVDRAALRGIRVQLVLTGPAPAYATGNRKKGVVKPNAARFASFAKEAARHFKGRINRYSIWNEPNLKLWISPSSSGPQIYRKLYEAGYKAIKKADKKAQVLIGETSPYGQRKRAIAPVAFLRSVACVNAKYKRVRKCKPLVSDGYAHHPYDYRVGPTKVSKVARGKDNATLGQISNLTSALSKLAKARALRTKKGKALDLFLTEFGYFAPGNKKYSLGESTRSKHLVNSFKLAQKNRRIKQLLQYLLVAVPPGAPGEFFDLSIVGLGGARSTPFVKLAAWAQKAKIKRPGGPIALPPRRN